MPLTFRWDGNHASAVALHCEGGEFANNGSSSMISRYRLGRPSRYVPFLAVGLGLLFLIPGGEPTGEAERASSATSST